jgi:hypothetical protein
MLYRLLCYVLFATIAIPVAAQEPTTANSPTKAAWTVLVFLNADNNLEPFGVRDFKEMARIGSTDKINIIVQMDRNPGFSATNPDWDNTLRFRITKDMVPSPQNAIADMGELNMGDGKTLEEFVRWGVATYPAERYMLIIWDHGDGWRFLNTVKLNVSPEAQNIVSAFRTLAVRQSKEKSTERAGETSRSALLPSDRGVEAIVRASSVDDTSGGDKLYNRETADALRAALGGTKLDVLGFDACLMGTVETAYAFRNVANVMVGSEELEPGDGWNYEDWLGKLVQNPEMDGKALGTLLVESYERHYSNLDTETTLAALDLTQIEALASSVTATAHALKSALDTELAGVQAARGSCKTYAPGYGIHNIDLECLMKAIKSNVQNASVSQASDATSVALKNVVMKSYAGADRQIGFGSYGAAIYFPQGRNLFLSDPDHPAYERTDVAYPLEFIERHDWHTFLKAYFSKVQ